MIAAYSKKDLVAKKVFLSELYLLVTVQHTSACKHDLTSVSFLHVALNKPLLHNPTVLLGFNFQMLHAGKIFSFSVLLHGLDQLRKQAFP